MPHLKSAIAAIRSQSYQNFELIVQDGHSSDETTEYLASIDNFPQMKIYSEADSGVGDAYGKAMQKCVGDLVCFTSADECIQKDAIKQWVTWFEKDPNAVAIFGAVSLVDHKGKEMQLFSPGPFDLHRFISCEYCPSFGGLFNRHRIGKDFYYDSSIKTVPDYDFWLRLGIRFTEKELISKSAVFNTALRGIESSTYRITSYEKFVKEKCLILSNFVKNHPNLKSYENYGKEGIYRWAANMACSIDPKSSLPVEYSNQAEVIEKQAHSPPVAYERVHDLLSPSPSLPKKIKNAPAKVFRALKRIFKYLLKQEPSEWENIITYDVNPILFDKHWIVLSLKVTSGAISVCFDKSSKTIKQKIFYKQSKLIETFFPLSQSPIDSIVFRYGGVRNSSFKLKKLCIVKES